MSTSGRPFAFDLNFNFSSQSVFSQLSPDEAAPFPPAPGFFLQLDNTPILQLDTTNLDLL